MKGAVRIAFYGLRADSGIVHQDIDRPG